MSPVAPNTPVCRIGLVATDRPFAKIEFRNGTARYLSSDGPEFKLQVVFGKSTLKRNAFKDWKLKEGRNVFAHVHEKPM